MNVVFDFDKTLTRKDTTRHLFFYLARANGQSSFPYVVYYLLYRLGILNEHGFKSAIVRRYIRGLSVTELKDSVSVFVDELKGNFMNEAILAELYQYLADGDKVFLASANFEFLIQAFCESNGIDNYFATSLETDSGRYTGAIDGSIIKGPEKLRTLESYFGSKGLREIKFYGDAEDEVLFERIANHVNV